MSRELVDLPASLSGDAVTPALPILCALTGSVFLSAGTILQWLGHEGARKDDGEGSAFLKIIRTSRWWGGIACGGSGTLLHYTALWFGALALIQPLGALHIALTALGMALLRREVVLGPRLWGIVFVTFGTALCLAGEADVSPGLNPSMTGALAFVGLLLVVATASVLMPRAAGRCAVLSGVAYSLSAVSWKALSETGLGGVGMVWAALFVVGYLGGFFMMQIGFRRGGAGAVNALAAGTATALPMAAAVIVFGESVSPLAWIGVAMIAFGVLLVGRVVTRVGRSLGI